MARSIISRSLTRPLVGTPVRWIYSRLGPVVNRARGWTPVPFVILGQPRCGTNAMTAFLNGLPSVVCHREIITNGPLEFSKKETENRPTPSAATDYWNWLYRAAPERRAVGWKYLNVHDRAFLNSMLADGFIRKLVLLRKNKFRQVLSNRLSTQAGLWRAESKTLLKTWLAKRHPVHLEPLGFLAEMDYYAQEDAKLRDLVTHRPAPFFPLWYEDCFGPAADRIKTEILRFLSLPDTVFPDSVDDQKMNPEPWRELVSNVDEIESALRATPYSWMLD